MYLFIKGCCNEVIEYKNSVLFVHMVTFYSTDPNNHSRYLASICSFIYRCLQLCSVFQFHSLINFILLLFFFPFSTFIFLFLCLCLLNIFYNRENIKNSDDTVDNEISKKRTRILTKYSFQHDIDGSKVFIHLDFIFVPI